MCVFPHASTPLIFQWSSGYERKVWLQKSLKCGKKKVTVICLASTVARQLHQFFFFFIIFHILVKMHIDHYDVVVIFTSLQMHGKCSKGIPVSMQFS